MKHLQFTVLSETLHSRMQKLYRDLPKTDLRSYALKALLSLLLFPYRLMNNTIFATLFASAMFGLSTMAFLALYFPDEPGQRALAAGILFPLLWVAALIRGFLLTKAWRIWLELGGSSVLMILAVYLGF